MYNNKQHANQVAQQWMLRSPLFFDTETTAFDGEILDLALVDCTGRVLLSSLVKPLGRISDGARAVHGITEEMVADAPTFPDVWKDFRRLTTGKTVIIYNADFDVRMLQGSASRYPDLRSEVLEWTTTHASRYMSFLDGYPSFYCAMKLYSEYRGVPTARGYRWHKLEDALKQCGIEVCEQKHRAMEDAEFCRLLVEHMARNGEGK